MDGLGRGQRIARARRRRGLSQAALAGLVGRSESWLSQVERGVREIDSHSVLTSLAEVLRVEVTDLTGDEASEPGASRYAAAREVERAGSSKCAKLPPSSASKTRTADPSGAMASGSVGNCLVAKPGISLILPHFSGECLGQGGCNHGSPQSVCASRLSRPALALALSAFLL